MKPRSLLIVDGYNDEPGGLGVPPYIDVYPRYIAGAVWAVDKDYRVMYMSVDELRARTLVDKVMRSFDVVAFVAGVVVPGKYIGGRPATASELISWASSIEGPIKVLVGPAARWGMGPEGGQEAFPPSAFRSSFDVLVTGDPEEYFYDLFLYGEEKASPRSIRENYDKVNRFAVLGSKIVRYHPSYGKNLIAEIETYRGCARWVSGGCSFCVEPLRGRPIARSPEAIATEVGALYQQGVRNFRLGRQADILVYGSEKLGEDEWPRPNAQALERLFYGIRTAAPNVSVLHIDNVNPGTISRYPDDSREALKVIVKYHTPGDVAALGIESVDPKVIKINNLKVSMEDALRALELINEVGSSRGSNGMPELLPGINFILGLPGERRETYRLNKEFLQEVLRRRLLVRRVNIRKILAIPSTRLYFMKWGVQDKYEPEARSFIYYVRHVFDRTELSWIAPKGTILTDIWVEDCEPLGYCYARQVGSYPLTIMLRGSYPRLYYIPKVVVTGVHSARAVEGVPVELAESA